MCEINFLIVFYYIIMAFLYFNYEIFFKCFNQNLFNHSYMYNSFEQSNVQLVLTVLNSASVLIRSSRQVSICAGANVMATWGAFATGVIASLVYYSISAVVEKLRIDDPLDAVAGQLTTWNSRVVWFFLAFKNLVYS